MHFLGEEGYLDYTRQTMDNKARLKVGIEEIAGLKVIDNDLCILCYVSEDEDLPIMEVLGGMEQLGWIHFGTLEPPMIQLILDPSPEPYIESYLKDLRLIVERIRAGERMLEGKLQYVG